MAYDRLKAHLGFEHETKIYAKPRILATPHEAILERFDVDTRFLGLGAYEGAQQEIDETTYLDEWGVTWRKAEDGHYFLNVGGPFVGWKDPDARSLEDHAWPDPGNPGYFRGLAERAAALRRDTDCAIVLNLTTGVIHQGQYLRGFANWLKDLYKHREFLTRLTEILAENWIAVARGALERTRGNVDVVYVGDDLASQAGPLFDPRVYRELIKPHHRRMVGAVKDYGVKVVYHSCGAVRTMLGDLVDIDVDAVNPVQVSADNMEPEQLKAEHGGRITFWGGIDSQHVLPFGTPEDVRAEARRMIDCLGSGGGFVLTSVHVIQNDVPAENIVAMFEEARDYRRR